MTFEFTQKKKLSELGKSEMLVRFNQRIARMKVAELAENMKIETYKTCAGCAKTLFNGQTFCTDECKNRHKFHEKAKIENADNSYKRTLFMIGLMIVIFALFAFSDYLLKFLN
jgi:predicted nucleic acid-binding Zn ribbon protein